MILKRDLEQQLIKMANSYPTVTVTGPRQSGKTTLVKKVFPDMEYVNLEAPDLRARIEEDPRGFLRQRKDKGIIFDEIQRLPDLLSYIQVLVDENNKPGQYILTGSHQFALSKAITQSLAGRTALLTLFPFSFNELTNSNITQELDLYLLKGFFPKHYASDLDFTTINRNYIQTYVERDVRDIINIKDLSNFQKFLRLCASRVGQILNKHSISNELGISIHTVTSWLSILEASYITVLLQPYYENFGKRIIKSPKLYFTDVGLAAHLLGIHDQNQMSRDPLRGQLYENMVVMELYKNRYNQGLEADYYFYRDNNQNEVDLIYRIGSKLVPIEIKSSETFHKQFLKNLKLFNKICGNKDNIGSIIYAGEEEFEINDFQVINYKNSYKTT